MFPVLAPLPAHRQRDRAAVEDYARAVRSDVAYALAAAALAWFRRAARRPVAALFSVGRTGWFRTGSRAAYRRSASSGSCP